MKSTFLVLPILLAACATAKVPPPEASKSEDGLDEEGHPHDLKVLELGDAAPDFALAGIDGKTHTLADYGGTDVLMVLFTSNHCPTSHSIEKRLQRLRDDMRGKSFAMVAINPNHPDGLSLDELGYGEFTDSFENMKPYAEKNGWDFDYLYDGDTQKVARAFGTLATPHVFLFDRERKLRYKGRFDDSRYIEDDSVTSPDTRNAIDDMLAGRPVKVPLTKPHGCSTKWREKKTRHAIHEASWPKIPVTIEKIDAAGVANLRANKSNKHRLINVWATWCAPCVNEFPSLIALSRRFDMRDFELVTISVDESAKQEAARAFLQNQGAGVSERIQPTVEAEGRTTNHYLFAEASQEKLFQALDPAWPGPLPHSVLVAPGGKLLWSHNGTIDHDTALEVIVRHLGSYYSAPKE